MEKVNFKSKKTIAAIFGIVVIGITIFFIVAANPDYILDTFSNETKIGKGTVKMDINATTGQVMLGGCYLPNPSWTWSTTTIVRDIATTTATATTTKKIFCDNYNCVFLPDTAATPSSAVCIATNPDVYANLLWKKTNYDYDSVYSSLRNSVLGYAGRTGGIHPTGLKVGNNSQDVGGKAWLERNFDSGTFQAMTICKAYGSGWRLPNVLELDSIRDQAKGSAPYTRLPNMYNSYYGPISSTEDSSGYQGWVSFDNGNYNSADASYSRYVRCVRDY